MRTRQTILRNPVTLLLATLATVACIKRQPAPVEHVAAAGEGAAVAQSGASAEDEAPSAPTGNYGKVAGVDLLAGKGLDAFEPSGKTERVRFSEVQVTGQEFSRAIQADVTKPSQDPWDVQLRASIPVAVQKNDVILATFFFRTDGTRVAGAEGETQFVFELGRDPYTKSVTHSARATDEWKQVYVPFQAEESYGPGEAVANFRLGYPPQRVQFAGVKLENFGKQLALADLPTTVSTYPGAAADAPWREAAAKRIDQKRKGDLEVVVQNAAGQPVAGAEVHIQLVRHAFGFGTAAPASKILDAQDPRFLDALAEQFNVVTLENDLKWQALAGDWGPGYTLERAQQAMAALAARGIATRGHVLVSPSWRHLPRALSDLAGNPAKLGAEVTTHIEALASELQGKVAEWDVVNEPYDNHEVIDLLGQRVMIDWFKTARAAAPDAKLCIEDYGMLTGGGSPIHRDHYAKTIQMLIDGGAPIDAVGMQAHFGTSLTAPQDLIATLDRFAKLGKPILITQFDVPALDEELAAAYTRDFYTAAFSHPAVQGIIMWGFWDGSHWKNNAPLYREDWSLKPAGEAYRQLVLTDWKTDARGQSGTDGVLEARGFVGEYVVTASHDGRHGEARGALSREGSRLVVKL